MFKKICGFASVAAICVATSAYAQNTTDPNLIKAGFIEETGASERINFSGKLRMLSQRIPGTACYAHAKVETEASNAMLQAAMNEFDLILNGLEVGEDSLGIIGPEQDRKVLIGLSKLSEQWDPLHPEIIDIQANGGTDEEVQHLAQASHEILRIAKLLVSAIVAEHSDPTAVLQADAMTIDIAGRQRMLAQRISKNACLLMTGLAGDEAQKEMAGARQIYDASANALRFGMPDAGIHATKNPEIQARLDQVLALWADVQPILDSVAAGEAISDDNKAYLYNSMNSLTGQMNTIVGMYTEESKLGL